MSTSSEIPKKKRKFVVDNSHLTYLEINFLVSNLIHVCFFSIRKNFNFWSPEHPVNPPIDNNRDPWDLVYPENKNYKIVANHGVFEVHSETETLNFQYIKLEEFIKDFNLMCKTFWIILLRNFYLN